MDNNQDIIDRIRKLLSMAADTSSPNEAAIAAGRARKLMDKHQIDLADLKDESTGFDFEKVDKSYRFMPMWKDILAVAVAELNDCKCCKSHEYRTVNKSYSYRLMFQGFEHDVAVAVAMYDYLSGTIERLCSAYMAEAGYTKYVASVGDAHKKAASRTVCARLRELLDERKEVFKSSTGTALVIYKMQQVEAEFGPREYESKNLPTKDTSEAAAAYRRGIRDGQNISLNTQVTDVQSPDRTKLTHSK